MILFFLPLGVYIVVLCGIWFHFNDLLFMKHAENKGRVFYENIDLL